MMTEQEITSYYISHYRDNKDFFSLGKNGNGKQEAQTMLEKTPIPGRRNEKYRYANIPGVLEKHMRNTLLPENPNKDIDEIFHCNVSGLDTDNLVMLNGLYYHDQKHYKTQQGIQHGSIREEADKDSPLFTTHYGSLAKADNEALLAINTMMSRDGVYIHVNPGITSQRPIQVINILFANQDTSVCNRNLVVVEENAELELIFCDHSLSFHQFMSNTVTEIVVGKNARVYATFMQNEHNDSANINHIFIKQHEGSSVNTNFISLNGGFIRNNLEVSLDGEHCEMMAQGLVIAGDGQYVDNFVNIYHNAPNCTSNQLYKGILENKSEVSFNGKIYVAKDAQKTNAFQTNKSLLLSKDAKVNSKPQLEIYADDVKCSHGAAIGKIDKDALFYLKSRGIPEYEARMLLMYAFADDVISNIKEKHLRERVADITDERLRGKLNKCKCCALNCNTLMNLS